jgi:hypothetical protein
MTITASASSHELKLIRPDRESGIVACLEYASLSASI